MRGLKKRRFSKRHQFDRLYQILRYAHASGTPLFRVVGVRDEPAVAPGSHSAFVVLEILGLPFTQGKRVNGALSARRVTEFFGEWKVQQELIKWYAKKIASVIPANSSLKALKGRLTRLTVGRAVSLPPQIYLKAEYQELIAEIGSLHACFGKQLRFPLSKEKYDEILKFGTDSGAKWVKFAKKQKSFLADLFNAPPSTVAKLILSKQYGCEEGSVHDRLFRTSD